MPPAVLPLPYSLVWFELAGAHVHLLVELLGLTPELVVLFAGAEQPLNLPPPSLVLLLSELVEPLELVAAVLSVEALAVFPWSEEALTWPDEGALAD
ncbi:MAG TPA: hypothetical protein VGL76_03325 [Gaiellaceae bacterium]|jgi:hypothetical protein